VAVTKPEEVRDYWPRYKRRTWAILLLGQIVIILALLFVATYFGFLNYQDPIEYIIIVGLAAGIVAINSAVIAVVLRPLQILSDAITHIAGEKNGQPLPNPNESKSTKYGLRPLLQTIYGLAGTHSEQSADDKAEENNSMSSFAALNDSAVGVAALNSRGEVVFNGKNVPVFKDPKGKKYLQLEFYTDTPFDQWLKNCEENTVRADKTWIRVATKPAGQPDRKIYDIVASYRKGSDTPVTAFFIDRTDDYAPEENDLNFIAFAAHELRGPITVIRGYLDTIVDELDDTITSEQRELFDRLIVSANRLSSYINNILNSAKYDQRHLTLNLVETRIIDVYATIADDMALRASSQRRVLNIDLPLELPTVAADPASASEVFGNLIDNALKYSNEGGVVTVSAEAKDNFVEVSVTDNGIGMPPNVISNLFHKFYRSHRSRETVAGTGIGLYISKGIIESHGGTMEVRSVENEGSTFSFTLPTYASVADKLAKSGGSNTGLIKTHGGGWIKNHGAMRG
jgi:signal transduction histidine kinase